MSLIIIFCTHSVSAVAAYLPSSASPPHLTKTSCLCALMDSTKAIALTTTEAGGLWSLK